MLLGNQRKKDPEVNNIVLNPVNKGKPGCRIRLKKVESPKDLRIENNFKEVHLFFPVQVTSVNPRRVVYNPLNPPFLRGIYLIV